jgi:hypothetical protein
MTCPPFYHKGPSMLDERILDVLDSINSDIERAKHLAELYPLLDEGGANYRPHTIMVLELINECLGRVHGSIVTLTAQLRAL